MPNRKTVEEENRFLADELLEAYRIIKQFQAEVTAPDGSIEFGRIYTGIDPETESTRIVFSFNDRFNTEEESNKIAVLSGVCHALFEVLKDIRGDRSPDARGLITRWTEFEKDD